MKTQIFRQQNWTQPRKNPQPQFPGMVKLKGFLKTQFEDSYDAITGILGMLEQDWEPEVERFAIAVETQPLCTMPIKRYMMASQLEMEKLQNENPELIFRMATQEELEELAARTEGYVEL